MRSPTTMMQKETAGGHWITSGGVLVGMGALGLVAAALLFFVFDHEMGFITRENMVVIALGNLALGVWMITVGKRDFAT